ncbi:MAG: helix-turn-helix domain-containing protein [Balneolales bacterium]
MPTLTDDIQAIRKHKKVSLNELYEKTKVPAHIIEMIDNGTIFTENPNNKIYIRSFIRTYAKGLGISNEDIIQALDDQEVDVYDGFLADKYINGLGGEGGGGSKPSGPLPSTGSSQTGAEKKAEANRKEEAESKKGNEKKEEENKNNNKATISGSAKASKKTASAKKSNAKDLLEEEDEKIRQTKSTHTSGNHSASLRPDSSKPYNQRTPEPPSISSVDWADTVKRFNPLESKSKIYLTLASVIVIMSITALSFYAFRANIFPLNFNVGNGTTANLDEAVQLPIAADTLAEDEADEPEVIQPEELPDTLNIIIYAAEDKLEPVRVRTDINSILTPYWVEHEEALQIGFLDEVLIRGQYSNMAIAFNGHIIENLRQFTTNDQFIRISREYLNDDPKWKTAGPDSFPSELQSPVSIREVSAE